MNMNIDIWLLRFHCILNNISYISQLVVVLVEETRYPEMTTELHWFD
jgi:hypothetical protein